MKLVIGYLYGDLMNIYGDTGNIIALKKRAEWRDIPVAVKNISLGDDLKLGDVDIYFFGGGQDQQQELVSKDLVSTTKGKIIKQDIERGVPLLSICGGYQLLGDYYQPHQGPKLPGIELFPAYTKAGNNRMIGNIIIESEFGKLVGFENHSGQTFLKQEAKPLGKVLTGFGNNGQDESFGKSLYGKPYKTEGCIYKNAIGCYMHGSLLPKNPKLADWLLTKALETKYKKAVELKTLDDTLEDKAHTISIHKFS